MKVFKKFMMFSVITGLIFNLCIMAGNAATQTYTVASGDTMWKVAQKFEIGIDELIKANPHIKNPEYLNIGDKLTIPEAAPLSALEDEVIRLVNAERAKYGLQALTKNWQASRVARFKAQDMADNKYLSHNSPTYGSPFNMMENFGLKFSSAAENIAMGQKTAAEVMKTWMNSPGHRANILSRNVTEMGAGAAKTSNGTMYWVQMFLKPAK